MAIMVVFLYHSTRFFNLEDWHVKNVNTFVWVEMWNVFATRWMMPLFFIISGASMFYSLAGSGGWRRFYSAKFQRLVVPVIIGSFTHGVLQVYLERLTHGRFSGSFGAFFSKTFNGVYLGIGMPGNYAFHGMHLWYLLFFISGYFAPLSLKTKTAGSFLVSRFKRLMAPWMLAVLILLPLYKVIYLFSRNLPQESLPAYFHFNRSGKYAAWLSRRSFGVYVIHFIVMGVAATVLLHAAVPSLVKYSLLAFITYTVSNALVYFYHMSIRIKLKE